MGRGKVFANAQTGNIVLMAVKLFAGEWGEALRYLMPLCAFALGIFVAEFIRLKLKRMQWLHWRQLVVLFEILLLFVVGFLPQELNLLANSLVSFSCAMQVQSFRKVNGYAFASTMCIGNLRSGMDSLCAWLVGGSTKAFGKALHYFAIIFLFFDSYISSRCQDVILLCDFFCCNCCTEPFYIFQCSFCKCIVCIYNFLNVIVCQFS